MARRGLGRGLNALISKQSKTEATDVEDAAGAGLMELELDRVEASPWQPRQTFDQEKLEDLANSIREQGLVQPLVVRKAGESFQLVAGERRLRAVRSLGWRKVPVVVMEASDARMRELALVENLQRDDLDPIETAIAYQALQKELNLTHEQIAERLGVSRAAITNTLRLLDLPNEVRGMVVGGSISQGHARALLSLGDDLSRLRLAKRIVEDHLTVRDVERLVKEATAPAPRKERTESEPETPRDPAVRDLEERLIRHLGTKVRIEDRGGSGRIVLEYYTHDDVTRILDKMGLPGEL